MADCAVFMTQLMSGLGFRYDPRTIRPLTNVEQSEHNREVIAMHNDPQYQPTRRVLVVHSTSRPFADSHLKLEPTMVKVDLAMQLNQHVLGHMNFASIEVRCPHDLSIVHDPLPTHREIS